MSCVWQGLAEGLYDSCGVKITEEKLYEFIKKNNQKTPDVFVNDRKLSATNLDENFEHIKSLESDAVVKGYLCSTSDPLLLLVCQIYKVSIQHNYCGVNIKYINQKADKKMFVCSNTGHFWSDKQTTVKYKKAIRKAAKKVAKKTAKKAAKKD
jgi:hypothetical protein